jgi:uncharacterized coiled-coil protein SlyX
MIPHDDFQAAYHFATLRAVLQQLEIEHGHSSDSNPGWPSCQRVHPIIDAARTALTAPLPDDERPRLREALVHIYDLTLTEGMSARLDIRDVAQRALALVAPAGPEEPREGLDHAEHFDPACEECAYLAPDNGAEERLRAALERIRDAEPKSAVNALVLGEHDAAFAARLQDIARAALRLTAMTAALHDSAPSGTSETSDE